MRVLGIVALCVAGVFILLAVIGMNEPPRLKMLHEAKDAVRAQLRDADSAEFRNVYVYQYKSGTLTACGEVNARNAFGGMAGYSRFVYFKGLPLMETPDSAEVFETAWRDGGCYGGASLAVASAP